MKSRGLVEKGLTFAKRLSSKRMRGRIRIVLVVGTAVFMLWSSPITAKPSLPAVPLAAPLTVSPRAAITNVTLLLENDNANGAVFGGLTTAAGGFGVVGFASDPSSKNFGVAGATNSSTGTGVFGVAFASTGPCAGTGPVDIGSTCIGVVGESLALSGPTAGVLGLTNSTGGAGLFALGVFGHATASSGLTSGVWGQSDSTTGTGVIGIATATSGGNIGVLGESDSSNGTGVSGFAPNIGVTGGTFTGVGVDGNSVQTGIAVRGRVGNAAGKLFSGLDPSGTEKFSVDSSGVIIGNGSGLTNLPVKYSSFVPTCDLNIPGAISTAPTNLGTIGTFIKANANSSIVIDWGGHAFAATVSSAVQFFLRVDGNPALGNQASGLLFSQNASQRVFLPMHAVFTGLAAGSHDVEMWVSIPTVFDSASGVAENDGCFHESVIVQEL